MLLQVPVLHRDFTDTSMGLNLTSAGAMDLARKKEDQGRLKTASESVLFERRSRNN